MKYEAYKNIFLVDAFGALLSAILLGVVLPIFHEDLGIPIGSLHLLALIPIFFIVYDLMVYFFAPQQVRGFLKIIAMLNLSYCCISLLVLIKHFAGMHIIGKGYFSIELLLVLGLALYEYRLAFK